MTTLSPVKTDAGQAVPVRPSLKNSRAYQYRIPLTAVVLVGSWLWVLLTPPAIDEAQPLVWFLDAAASAPFAVGLCTDLGHAVDRRPQEAHHC